jgi:hypothetical protein
VTSKEIEEIIVKIGNPKKINQNLNRDQEKKKDKKNQEKEVIEKNKTSIEDKKIAKEVIEGIEETDNEDREVKEDKEYREEKEDREEKEGKRDKEDNEVKEIDQEIAIDMRERKKDIPPQDKERKNNQERKEDHIHLKKVAPQKILKKGDK